MTRVDLTEIRKDISKLPLYIVDKLFRWADGVEKDGIEYMRTIPGYRDEALKGTRIGQRSIRLNKSYRAIYRQTLSNELILIIIEEVNKHEY